jgi:hypothetical protein
LTAVALMSGCGGGDEGDTTNGMISATPASLAFTGAAPAPQTISIAYVAPPTEVVLAGYPAGGVNPTCIGVDPTCRLSFALASAADANPLVFSVTIEDTSAAHTSTLRFVSTDLAYQSNYGYVDVSVRYTP